MSGDESMDTTVAIIGYGTAGVNALIALRAAGYHGKVLVFSDTSTLPYSPILTSEYAGGAKTYEECFPWSADELDALGAEIFTQCPVTHLDPEAHIVETAEGTYSYTKCIIASGSTPNITSFEGGSNYQPLVLKSMEDAQALKEVLSNPATKRVLVSGASLVALKTVEACLHYGITPTLVGMNPHVLDFNAFPETAERFERGLESYGVRLLLGQTIQSVKRVECTDNPRGWELEVSFSTGATERFDEITTAHGMKCCLDFLPEGSLKKDRALLVDEFMRTSNPDIYAAGDIAQALELVSGEKRIVGIWKNAAVQGACAGKAIAAELAGVCPAAEDAYKGAISTNTIAVNDTLFISAGSMELTPSRRIEISEADDMTLIYLFEDKGKGKEDLVGFNITCDHNEEGGVAYDKGAMLTLRIEEAARS